MAAIAAASGSSYFKRVLISPLHATVPAAVMVHLLLLLPMIFVFPVPRRYRTLSAELISDPSHVFQVSPSVEYYSVPSQPLLLALMLKLSVPVKVR